MGTGDGDGDGGRACSLTFPASLTLCLPEGKRPNLELPQDPDLSVLRLSRTFLCFCLLSSHLHKPKCVLRCHVVEQSMILMKWVSLKMNTKTPLT